MGNREPQADGNREKRERMRILGTDGNFCTTDYIGSGKGSVEQTSLSVHRT